VGCVFNHPTWQVTREEVHDALIASGASDEAAHDIINKIPFSRQGVVSTTILAEMFRAATHTDSETDSEEGSARLDEDAVPPDSNLAGETVHSSEGAGHGATQGGEQPSPESKEVPAPLRGVASAHSQESGWAYAETPLRTGHVRVLWSDASRSPHAILTPPWWLPPLCTWCADDRGGVGVPF